jgi:flagellar protein FlaG
MADQVNPIGSAATGPPQLLIAVAAAQPAPTQTRPAKAADTQPSKPESASAGHATQVTDGDLELINSQLQAANSNLKFQIDEVSGISYFKILDSATGKVIRQVPSEEILSMARKLRELSSHQDASGVLMDKEG